MTYVILTTAIMTQKNAIIMMNVRKSTELKPFRKKSTYIFEKKGFIYSINPITKRYTNIKMKGFLTV